MQICVFVWWWFARGGFRKCYTSDLGSCRGEIFLLGSVSPLQLPSILPLALPAKEFIFAFVVLLVVMCVLCVCVDMRCGVVVVQGVAAAASAAVVVAGAIIGLRPVKRREREDERIVSVGTPPSLPPSLSKRGHQDQPRRGGNGERRRGREKLAIFTF